MEFVYEVADAQHELDLTVVDPAARVSDLAAALAAGTTGLVIDGQPVDGPVGLRASGLVCGSLVTPVGAARRPVRGGAARIEARVVGGLDAGLRVPLPVGETVIGRDAAAPIRIDRGPVSRRHAVLTVAATGAVVLSDLGSRNGVDVNGVIVEHPVAVEPQDTVGVAGAALLRVVAVPGPDRIVAVDAVHGVRHGWRVPFPRGAHDTPVPPAAVLVPRAPERPHRSPLMYTAMVMPLGLAAVTIWLFRDWRFAVFAMVAPLGYLASLLEDRVRGQRRHRRSRRAYRTRVQQFGAQLAAAREQELAQRVDAAPDPAEAAFRAAAPGTRLWERRAGRPNFLRLAVASGDRPWQPELLRDDRADDLPPDVSAALEAEAVLPRTPVLVDLSASPVLGLEGDRAATLAAARALVCQAAVTAGPADLAIAVFLHPAAAARWEWAKWLPHLLDRASGTTRMVAIGRAEADALAAELAATHPFPAADRGALLVIVDGAGLLEGRHCPLRDLIADRSRATRAVVVANPLPAQCTTVLTVASSGAGRLHTEGRDRHDRLLVAGQSEEHSAALARSLARFEDPEIALAGAGLPEWVPLLPLLELGELRAGVLLDRWRAGARSLRARAVIGVTETGRCEIDLDDDGPHALIAGTTGSGKSELLRTLVTSLAVGNDPDHLVFVLIDYKGGGALDECALLPHVVGLVTDLDGQLSRRALRCLEAELRHRERALRAAHVSDFREYQRLRDTGRPELAPMPRMAVVIDEFATLVKALPTFVDSLVDVAQRGRSLGVHLIIATQRPAGSVSDAIKANVKLRVALRLETREDSGDVIDSPAAASIGPRRWGRAFRRLGGGEVEAVQTALASGVTDTVAPDQRVRLRAFSLSGTVSPTGPGDTAPAGTGRTDLSRLVELASDAFAAGGHAPPRRPWPAPLPALAAQEDWPGPAEAGLQGPTPDLPAFVLADDPDRQRQVPLGWDPDAGNLLVFGAVGSGTTTALASLVLAWCRARSPDQLRVYVIDHGDGGLAALGGLPHTGGYVRTDDRERLVRVTGLLTAELRRRKSVRVAQRWLVAIDGLGALLTGSGASDDPVLGDLVERLGEVYAEGPAVGICFAANADRGGGVPGSWLARTAQRLLLALADAADYGSFGVSTREVPAPAPGRGVVAATHQVVQVLTAREGMAHAVDSVTAGWPDAVPAPPIKVLPDRISQERLTLRPRTGAYPWAVPVGLAQETLEPVALPVHEHDHVLIAGPRRSGRSTVLATVARALSAAGDIPLLAYAPRSSPVRDLLPPVVVTGSVHELTAAVQASARAPVVLVDDADAFDDRTGLFLALATHDDPGLHVFAVARNDGPVRAGSHWLALVRRSRCGVLLNPEFLDGDLLGVSLPRRSALRPAPGRGYLISDGSFVAIQAAVPDHAAPAGRRVIG